MHHVSLSDTDQVAMDCELDSSSPEQSADHNASRKPEPTTHAAHNPDVMDEEGLMSFITQTGQTTRTHTENNDNTDEQTCVVISKTKREDPNRQHCDTTQQHCDTTPQNCDNTRQHCDITPQQDVDASTQHNLNTSGQDVCESAHQQDSTTSRKRKLDTRTQHPDTSSQHNHDKQLRDAVSRGRWLEVPDLITSDVSDACRAWAVEEACKNAYPTFVESRLVPLCTEDQLRSLFPVLVRRGLCRAVRQCLDRGVSDEHRRLAVQTVSEKGDEDAVLAILPYCPDVLLDSVVLRVCGRGLWRAVSVGLQRGVSDTVRRSVVEAACGHADEYHLYHHKYHLTHVILRHYNDDQVDNVIYRLINRHLWRAASFLSQRGVSDTERTLAVETAREEADEDSVLLLLPYCPDDLLDTVLVQVTSRSLWRATIEVLQRGVSDTERKLAVQAACDRADEHHLTHGILCHCHDDQMDSVLTRLVERSLWGAARWLLVQSRDGELCTGTGTDTTQHTPAGNEDGGDGEVSTGTRTDTTQHTPAPNKDGGDGQTSVSSILISAVSRGLWSAVRALLQHISHVTQAPVARRWAVTEACDDTQTVGISLHCDERIRNTDTCCTHCNLYDDEFDDKHHIVEVADHEDTKHITIVAAVRFCTDIERDAVLAEAKRRELINVNPPNSPFKVLTVRPGTRQPFCRLLTITDYISSSDIVRWAVEEACKRADDEECVAIVDVCPVGLLNTMLTQAVRRGLWKTVIWLLARITITDTRDTHSITVEEACARTEDGGCVAVLRFSTQTQRDTAMTEAVRRGLCERTNNDSKRTDDGECVAVCFSSQAQRDAVMTEAVRRGLCKRVDGDSGVSDTERWTVGTGVLDTDALSVWQTFCTLLQTDIDHIHHHIYHTRDTQRWAVEEACRRASDNHFIHVVSFCADDQLGTMLTEAVRRDLWKTVTRLLERIREGRVSGVNNARRRAVEEACKRADDDELKEIVDFCDGSQREILLTQAVTRGLWKTVAVLLYHDTISHTAQQRAVKEAFKHGTDEEFHTVADCIREKPARLVDRLPERGMRNRAHHIVEQEFVAWNSYEDSLAQWAELFVDSLSTHSDEDSHATKAESELKKHLESIIHVTDKCIDLVTSDRTDRTNSGTPRELFSAATSERVWTKMISVLAANSVQHTDVYPHFFKWCVQRRGRTTSLCQLSLPLIATQTVNPALQSLARTSMWEETRRWYLQFLVEEELWAVVKEVADHCVYDDQRAWALEQARHHKQWDVVVHLADHGLTDNHRWRVYRQVAKYADWDAVRLLFKRGVDMRRVCEELMAANPSRERPPDNGADIERRRNRGEDVRKLEAEYRERSERVARLALEHKQRCRELDTLEKRQAGRRDGKMSWYAVLSQLRQDVTEEEIEMTLQHAIQSEAWSVVVQLVRLGMDAAQRDRLFPETIRRRQWGVARALLEQGVSVELSRAALPELMETDQWILVARVMEQSLDDTDRRRVMQVALDKKEGSVVVHGISVMEGRLSVEERQAMYDQALSQGVWQAVRRLVEEKDNTGIAQRDEVLVVAVDQHRWDIVKHCVLQGVDINKQNDDGDTMLHEKARRRDWDSVDGLVHYGADPNLTDRRGYSAFHMSVGIAAHQYALEEDVGSDVWNALKTSVKFHGNLNRPDPEGHTPLFKLINCRYTDKTAEILDDALWWGSDVAQGQRVVSRGKTVLHVMCQAGRWKSIQYVLARGVHPLAVTYFGDTALVVAVQCEKDIFKYVQQYGKDDGRTKRHVESRECRQKLVAECIKLGISTHQPKITDNNTDMSRSPVYMSMEKRDLVVLHMLFESGACSHRELCAVFDHPPRPPRHYDRLYMYNKDLYEDEQRYKQCLSYLKNVATTPRSLQSTCRLVISHHLGICKPRTRQERVKQLRLPDRMKDYVLFSDLIDPDKVKDTVTQLTREYDT